MTNFKEGEEVFIQSGNDRNAFARSVLHTIPKLLKNGNFKIPGYDCQFRQSGYATGYSFNAHAPQAIKATPSVKADRDSLRAAIRARAGMIRFAETIQKIADRPMNTPDERIQMAENYAVIHNVLMEIFDGIAEADNEMAKIKTSKEG